MTQDDWDSGNFYLQPKGESPMLWDADFEVGNDSLIISGYLSPGGGGAVATLTISNSDLDEFYDIIEV